MPTLVPQSFTNLGRVIVSCNDIQFDAVPFRRRVPLEDGAASQMTSGSSLVKIVEVIFPFAKNVLHSAI